MSLKFSKKYDILRVRIANYAQYNHTKMVGDFGRVPLLTVRKVLSQALSISPFFNEPILFFGVGRYKTDELTDTKKVETWSHHRSPDKVTGYTGSNGLLNPALSLCEKRRLIKANSTFLFKKNKFYYQRLLRGSPDMVVGLRLN